MQRDLARRMGRPYVAINEIIRGKKRVIADTALDFEDARGIRGPFWGNLQARNDLVTAFNARRNLRAS